MPCQRKPDPVPGHPQKRSHPADHHPKIFIFRFPTTLYPHPARSFPHPPFILESKCRALACRTPATDVPGSPAATLGEGQRQGSAIDPKLWPAIGLTNTGAHGGLQNLETASSLTISVQTRVPTKAGQCSRPWTEIDERLESDETRRPRRACADDRETS